MHKGFKTALDVVWQEIEQEVLKLENPVFFTGHSLGGALALAAAARSKLRPLAVYTFGAPRVGDPEFNNLLEDIPVYRLVNNSDIVPTLPPPGPAYRHTGELRLINAEGEMIINPDRQSRIKRRLESIFDFEDLRGQLESLAPHKMLYEHAPVNYSNVLRYFL